MMSKIRKMFHKVIHNERGFTLIELVVVVMILGILASIAIPRFTNKIGEAHNVKTRADITIIQTAVDLYFLDYGVYPVDTQKLADEGYLKENPYKVDGTSRYLIDQNNGHVY